MFVDGKGKKLKLTPFRGNCFNILFFDAEQVFYLRDKIKQFLQETYGTSNLLLQSVLSDICNSDNLASAKVLGLISKLITAPLWRIIESKDSVLDMNVHFKNLHDF